VSGGVATEPLPGATAKPARRRRDRQRDFDRPRFLRFYVAFAYLFLAAPILVVILFSFNAERSLQNFTGFSLRWYEEFLNDSTLRESLFASLQIAVATMVIGTILGTMLAIGLVRSRARWSPGANILMLIPLVVPEIVAGISALLIFSQVGLSLSIFTVILAHVTFSISYVAIVVRARLATIGVEAEEAAMDLGATRWGSVRLVLLPALWPAIVAAGLLIFALSFDDFVLSFFTTGEDVQPLPVRIWSAIRFGISPTINAIGTLMMVISISAIGLALLLPRLFGRRESGIKVLTGQEG
jgi:spermidine/putrescine transport system permease protein/putrescine transport system permease protein